MYRTPRRSHQRIVTRLAGQVCMDEDAAQSLWTPSARVNCAGNSTWTTNVPRVPAPTWRRPSGGSSGPDGGVAEPSLSALVDFPLSDEAPSISAAPMSQSHYYGPRVAGMGPNT